jgi:hypothetical protein
MELRDKFTLQGVDWIHLVKDRDQLWVVVKTVTKLWDA